MTVDLSIHTQQRPPPAAAVRSKKPSNLTSPTPRTITPPLHTPFDDDTKTPPLSRSDSKMTSHSGFAKPSFEMSPITPRSSPQHGSFSPRFHIPASPPSPLSLTHGQNIAAVISSSNCPTDFYGKEPRHPNERFRRPPRKSSLSGIASSFKPGIAPASVPTMPAWDRHRTGHPQFSDAEIFVPRPPFVQPTRQHDSDRSSLFSKVSSIFDAPRRFEDDDDAMTVEDAIKMYEDGFYDSSDSSAPSAHGSPKGLSKPRSPRLKSRNLEARRQSSTKLRKIKSADSMRPPTLDTTTTSTKPKTSAVPFNLKAGVAPALRKAKSSALLVPRSETGGRLSSELFVNDALSSHSNSPISSPTTRISRPALPTHIARAATMPNPKASQLRRTSIPTVSFTSDPSPKNHRDRYGFRKESHMISRETYDEWDLDYSVYLHRRQKKWHALMRSHGLSIENPTVFPPKTERVKRYIRKGIPPEWRGNAWFWYSGGPRRLKSMSGVYDRLVRECADLEAVQVAATEPTTPRSERRQTYVIDREHIERDLHRTFPDNVLFKPDSPQEDGNKPPSTPQSRPDSSSDDSDKSAGQPPKEETPMLMSLRRVLRAFALHKPSIGYCQSLNFLAGLLLLFLHGNEEKAFIMLDIITTDHLPGTHARVLEANVDVGVLMDLVRQELPSIWSKIDDSAATLSPVLTGAESIKSVSTVRRFRRRVTPSSAVPSLQRLQNRFGGNSGTILDQASNSLPTVSLATTSWFMSLFIGSLPIESVARIWDSFFAEGAKVLFRASLAVFRVCEPKIRALDDRMEIFQLVQSVPRSFIDVNQLMDACWRRRGGFGRITHDTVEDRRQQRRHVVRGENEARRDAESRSSSPPPTPVLANMSHLPLPSSPRVFRSTTVTAPSLDLGSARLRADSFKRQATFS